jgi:DNA-binding TFAR19-related protein (PDSD5 family)
MFQRLKAEAEEHPKLFHVIQQHILRQAIQASARERLEKLLTDGIVSGPIAKKLAAGLESE